MKYNLKNLLYFLKRKPWEVPGKLQITSCKNDFRKYLPGDLEFRLRNKLLRRKEVSQLKFFNVDYTHAYKKDYSWDISFFLQLKQVIAWTEHLIREAGSVNPPDCTRIFRQTDPVYHGKPMHRILEGHGNYITFNMQYFDYRIPFEQALHARSGVDTAIRNAHLLGQVLEFDIDDTTMDGAPTAESLGFVDDQDIPPIDTWFYLTQSHLYCWIPNMFIPVMQGAMDVEILDSYRWIKEANSLLQKKINHYLISSV